MKPTRNERSPSEHGDEKNTRRKKMMKVDNTEGGPSDVNMGASSASEEYKITINADGDIEMFGREGLPKVEVVAQESASTYTALKAAEGDSEKTSIEKALEKVCGEPGEEVKPEEKEPGTEDEASEDSMMPDEPPREESPTFTDDEEFKKLYGDASGDEDTSEDNSKQEGPGASLPTFKDDEAEKPKEKKKDNKKKRAHNDDDDDDSDEDGNDDDGRKPGKGKKKDKDDDGSGTGGGSAGGKKPDGDSGEDKDDSSNDDDKPAGGEKKDGDDKDGGGGGGKGGSDENSDDSDGDVDMGGNGGGDKSSSDEEDGDEMGGSSEDGGSAYEASEVEESENYAAEESEAEITDDDESDDDDVALKGLGGLTEEGIGGIIFDRDEDAGGNIDVGMIASSCEFDIAGTIDPYDVESDADDEPSIEEDYCEFLSQDGGSAGEDDHSYYGDDDYLEEVEEVRGTG